MATAASRPARFDVGAELVAITAELVAASSANADPGAMIATRVASPTNVKARQKLG
jgi:hypothetical protein